MSVAGARTHVVALQPAPLTIFDQGFAGMYVNMGCLRLVGTLKLQVSFAIEPYKRDDILQKRPGLLRSLLIVCM